MAAREPHYTIPVEATKKPQYVARVNDSIARLERGEDHWDIQVLHGGIVLKEACECFSRAMRLKNQLDLIRGLGGLPPLESLGTDVDRGASHHADGFGPPLPITNGGTMPPPRPPNRRYGTHRRITIFGAPLRVHASA